MVSCRTRFRIPCCVPLSWLFSLDSSRVFPGPHHLNAFEGRRPVVSSHLPQCGLIRCVLVVRLGLASLAGASQGRQPGPPAASRVARGLLCSHSRQLLWRGGCLQASPLWSCSSPLWDEQVLCGEVLGNYVNVWFPIRLPVSSFIILMYKFSQFCPVGALSRWFLFPFRMSSSFFEPFLAFCHNKMFQAHLVFCLPQPWNQPCLQGALFLWLEKSFVSYYFLNF